MKRIALVFLPIIIASFLFTCQTTRQDTTVPNAQIKFTEIPSDSVLLYALSPEIPGLSEVYKYRDAGNWD